MEQKTDVALPSIESRIYEIRGQKVMLDRDLALLYNIETKQLNQSVKRNRERFPSDFMFQLSKEEFMIWRSQIVTSKSDKQGLRYLPYAFTEQGVAMLSGILNSKTAIEVNIAIMRTFVAVRHVYTQSRNYVTKAEFEDLKQDLEDIFADYNYINEDTRVQLELINQSLAKLQKEAPPSSPRRRIGYK
ncbi:MAG: ORF6N domain-containing protein [Paludibacteraceae bacterium]|nr:ORF6N domain-containing protein [Paludibacteraceae bacterium]